MPNLSNDLTELGVNSWKRKAENREEWSAMAKESKNAFFKISRTCGAAGNCNR